MQSSEQRNALLILAAAHVRGDRWELPAWVREPRGALALRCCLTEVLTALTLRGTPLGSLRAAIRAGVEDTPVLPLPPRQAAAEDYATVQLLCLLGAEGLMETTDPSPPEFTCPPDFEDLGGVLADWAACAVAPLATPASSTLAGRHTDMARAGCLAAARFHPRASARILRWLPFCPPSTRESPTMASLVSYLRRGWPENGDVAFATSVIQATAA